MVPVLGYIIISKRDWSMYWVRVSTSWNRILINRKSIREVTF